MPEQLSRIVVLSPNWLGDAVMSLPAIADVRRHFSGATLAIAARGALARVFELVPDVDAIVPLAPGGSLFKRRRADEGALRSGQFDLAVLYPNSFYSAWIVKRAGIPERWGYRADFRRALLTRTVRRPKGTIHRAAYYQHLVRELGMPSGLLRPHLPVPEQDRAAGQALLSREGWSPSVPIVGLAPGAAYGFAKQWPPTHFGVLARLLVERGIWCVLVGLAADRDAGGQVMAAFEQAGTTTAARGPGRVLNLIGRTDIRQLMGLMTHCGSFVSNDSGAAYLAAAVGSPVVTIFGPTDERVAAPLPSLSFAGTHAVLSHPVFCSPCWLRECPIDHRCMKRVEPARAFDAVMQQLAPFNP
jgi:heptosyltransferase-2